MNDKKTGGPAFPNQGGSGNLWNDKGMTLREYAAIKLKVPDSGMDWLDDMIRASLRDECAAKVMPEIYQRVETGGFERVAKLCYEMADAMLKAREA